ncbi:MAG: tRNA epoxyqueuosine(34) reductase QueG [Chitinophagaceae bacterium]|jgi:epoxyqueuosine reductase|nr:tRNA epoxyqueuosine(34) reductase QueG [Chitinophagaceae bacterium]
MTTQDRLAETHTRIVKSEAAALGFEACGIARAERLDDDARRLERWLSQGMNGGMSYMERHFDLRIDPTRLVPGARSVITLLMSYHQEETQVPGAPKIASYAWGADYHEVIRAKLNQLLDVIRNQIGAIDGRGFVDSAPVLERSWAQRAGLGWVGRNGNLINRSMGSEFFIATLITDLELMADDPFAKDWCGSCRRCIDACPTEAILPDKVVDGSKCISYFTIELKDNIIPREMQGKFDDWMFGCDVCQDVCPWNRFAKPTREAAFQPLPEILNFTTREWEALTEDAFRKIFRHSPLKRSKHTGIMRNLSFLRSSADQISQT